jgi:signal transduction histidine kinase
VAKYAEASRAVIRLRDQDSWLTFEVSDDGRGFDPAATGHGSGLLGMADRLDTVRGALEVRSAPGAGTTLVGRVPVATSPATESHEGTVAASEVDRLPVA